MPILGLLISSQVVWCAPCWSILGTPLTSSNKSWQGFDPLSPLWLASSLHFRFFADQISETMPHL